MIYVAIGYVLFSYVWIIAFTITTMDIRKWTVLYGILFALLTIVVVKTEYILWVILQAMR